MMIYGYSAARNVFYLLSDKEAYEAGGTWCDDIIPVSNEAWAEYSGNAPQGKTLGATEQGQPCWSDAPAPTQEDQIKEIELERETLMSVADMEIRRLQNVSCAYDLTDAEKKLLLAWQKYLADLYRMKCSDVESLCWPVKPSHKVP